MSNDAIYFPNILQLAISLKYGDSDYFNKIDTYAFGNTPEHDNDYSLIGTEQALEFANEIYRSDYFENNDFISHLKFNPLIKLLNINEDVYSLIEKPSISIKSIPEGSKIPSNGRYIEFETSPVFMSQIAFSMDRIIDRQSAIGREAKSHVLLAKKYGDICGGRPQIVNMGSIKQYNATLSSYCARASHIVGIERFIDKSLIKQSEEAYKNISHKFSWHLKSQEIVNSVNNDDNNKLFANVTDKYNELLDGGVYFLKKEQYLNGSLLAFSLDGEIENTISTSIQQGPSNYFDVKKSDEKIIDSYYQSIFDVKCLKLNGVYGSKGRDVCNLKALPKSVHSSFRVKRNKVPQMLVNTIEELNEVINSVTKQSPDKDVYFRGQGMHHKLDRPASVNKFLYGEAVVNELSLPTSASRKKFDFDSFNSAFQMHIQGMMYSKIEKSKFSSLHDNWKYWSHYPPCTDELIFDTSEKWFKLFYSYEWDLMVMALAQHYGISTHGLDITSNLNVALWFATNRWYEYNVGEKKLCWYKELERPIKKDINDYPVIYIVATDKNLKRDLDQVEYAGFKALRPERQGAFLHFGGWGLHSNVCAEDIVTAIHLSEKVILPTLPKTEWLFPTPEKDQFYKDLLELKNDAMKAGFLSGFEDIAEYRKEQKV
jgi:hypothetical protein